MDQPDDSENAARLVLERLYAGDTSAQDDLLRLFAFRIQRMADRLLKTFPDLGRWVDSSDVYQSAMLRLLNAMGQVQVNSPDHFVRLAARQVRYELLDLARYYRRQIPMGGAHESWEKIPMSTSPDQEDPDADVDRIVALDEFREQVSSLHAEDRQILDYAVFLGIGQDEAARRLGISKSTLKRKLSFIRSKLHKLVFDSLAE